MQMVKAYLVQQLQEAVSRCRYPVCQSCSEHSDSVHHCYHCCPTGRCSGYLEVQREVLAVQQVQR